MAQKKWRSSIWRSSVTLRVAAMVLLMWNLQLSASTVTWTGAGSNNNWTTVGNWSCGGGPCTAPMTTAILGNDVTLPAGLSSARPGPLTGGVSFSMDSLTIMGSEYTVFTVSTGSTLTI